MNRSIKLVCIGIILVILAIVTMVYVRNHRGALLKTNSTQIQTINTDIAKDIATDETLLLSTTTTNMTEEKVTKEIALLNTNMGTITIELFKEKAPVTVENFIKLAEQGFYNGIRFHRVIPEFMIQSGDPLSKNIDDQDYWGMGGPGYTFADEIHSENQNNVGTIAMANAGPGTNGSQFFINVKNNNFLDMKHTVFGKVVSGMNIVIDISEVETEGPNRPVNEVVIKSISIK